MDYQFHPDALIEFKAEIAYYESVRPGLGADFSERVLNAVQLTGLFPNLGASEGDGVRSLVTKRFPFIVYYEAIGDCIWIWAVMHGAREPGYWRTRRPH